MFNRQGTSLPQMTIDSIRKLLDQRGPMIALAWAVISVVAACLLWIGSPVLTYCPWDVPMFYDGAWRILNGQIPHADFLLPTGALTWYVAALGMRIAGPSASGVVVGNVVLMVLVAVVASYVLRRRAPPWMAALCILLWSVMVVAPRPIGNWYRDVSFAVLYNRHGEAILGLLYAVLFVPRCERATRTDRVIETGIAGMLAAVLLFAKINYALLGITALVAAAVTRRDGRTGVHAWYALGVAAVTSMLICAVSGMTPATVLHDYFRCVSEEADAGRIRQFILGLMNMSWLLPVLAVAGAQMRAEDRREQAANWAAATFMLVSCALVLATNRQFDESPLLVVVLLLFLVTARRPWSVPSAIAGALLAVASFRTLQADLMSCSYSVTKRPSATAPASLAGTALHDFRIDPRTQRAYFDRIEAGAALVGAELGHKKSLVESMRLAVLDCTDPYTLAFRLRPRKGGLVWFVANDEEQVRGASHVLVLLERTAGAWQPKAPDGWQTAGIVSSNATYGLLDLKGSSP